VSGFSAGGAAVSDRDAFHPVLLRAAQGAGHRRLLQELHRGSGRGRRRLLVRPDGRAQTRKRDLADFGSLRRRRSATHGHQPIHTSTTSKLAKYLSLWKLRSTSFYVLIFALSIKIGLQSKLNNTIKNVFRLRTARQNCLWCISR